jgi:hypothetical protein
MKCKCGRTANWDNEYTWFGDWLRRVYYCPKCLKDIRQCDCSKWELPGPNLLTYDEFYDMIENKGKTTS